MNISKIILNNDGSIKIVELPLYIEQNNNGVDELQVGLTDASIDNYSATANFELPDGSISSLVGIAANVSDNDGNNYSGFSFVLTQAQTLYSGILKVSISIKDVNDNLLYSYKQDLTINATVSEPEEQTITLAQYNSLVKALNSLQEKYSSNNVRGYSSTPSDFESIATAQIYFVNESGLLQGYSKISGSSSGSKLDIVKADKAEKDNNGNLITSYLKTISFKAFGENNLYSIGRLTYIKGDGTSSNIEITIDEANSSISGIMTSTTYNDLYTTKLGLASEEISRRNGDDALERKITNEATTRASQDEVILGDAKTYTNELIANVKKSSFTLVNTTTYTTLDSFLNSTGEEGYVYLYPINLSDTSEGYYQYIWEGNAWLSLGSTALDLTNYLKKDGSDKMGGDLDLNHKNINNVNNVNSKTDINKFTSSYDGQTFTIETNNQGANSQSEIRVYKTNSSGQKRLDLIFYDDVLDLACQTTVGTDTEYAYIMEIAKDGTCDFLVGVQCDKVPTNNKDLVNKEYVDTKIGDIDTLLTALDSGTGV